MQHGLDPGFLHQDVGDVFEHLAVERIARRLRLGHRGPHRPGPLLEFDADAFAIDGFAMPVPGEAFDPHLRDIAAEAAVAIHQHGCRARAGGGEGGREARGSAADDQNVGFGHHIDVAGRFVDLFHADILTRRHRPLPILLISR